MAKLYETISPELRDWLQSQPVFFVATAPLAAEGHVNCSPKGGDTFRVLDERTVAYLDLTGSGIETMAHLRENGRIVIMFCAFTGAPQIVRLHGRGETVLPEAAEFGELIARFPGYPGARAIIRVRVARIADSCGYAVPRMDYVAPRDVLEQWAERKGPEGLQAYREANNRVSIDGLPGYESVTRPVAG
jgi:hypothetical protein